MREKLRSKLVTGRRRKRKIECPSPINKRYKARAGSQQPNGYHLIMLTCRRIIADAPSPEMALYASIIHQAAADCSCEAKYGVQLRDFMAARKWLLGSSEWFIRCCDFAGINPDYIIACAKHGLGQTDELLKIKELEYQRIREQSTFYENARRKRLGLVAAKA